MKTKSITFVSGVLAASLLLFSNSPASQAAGGSANVDMSVSPSSLAVGKNATISLFSYYYKCSDGYSYSSSTSCTKYGGTVTGKKGEPGNFYIKVSGSGNNLSASLVKTTSSGYGSATLGASVAGARTVSVYSTIYDSSYNLIPHQQLGTASVTFAAAATSTQSSTSYSAASTADSTSSAATSTKPKTPSAPKVNKIMVGNKVVSTKKPIVIKVNQPLTLQGKTIKNGKVTLYIHSKPRIVTVKANDKGEWKYSVKGLESGEHHVDVQVTDPASGKKSKKTSLLDFTVEPYKNLALATNTNNGFNPLGAIALASVAALAVIGVGVLLWRKFGNSGWKFFGRNNKTTASNTSEPASANSPETTTEAEPPKIVETDSNDSAEDQS